MGSTIRRGEGRERQVVRATGGCYSGRAHLVGSQMGKTGAGTYSLCGHEFVKEMNCGLYFPNLQNGNDKDASYEVIYMSLKAKP